MQLGEGQQRLLAYSGVGLALGMGMLYRYRRNPHLINHASSYGMAGRALLIGTLLSVASVGMAVSVGSAYLGVTSVCNLMLSLSLG